MVSPGVCSKESPEHVAVQAQGLSGHFGMWSLSALQPRETWMAPHGLAGVKSIFLLWCRTAFRIAVCAMLWK